MPSNRNLDTNEAEDLDCGQCGRCAHCYVYADYYAHGRALDREDAGR